MLFFFFFWLIQAFCRLYPPSFAQFLTLKKYLLEILHNSVNFDYRKTIFLPQDSFFNFLSSGKHGTPISVSKLLNKQINQKMKSHAVCAKWTNTTTWCTNGGTSALLTAQAQPQQRQNTLKYGNCPIIRPMKSFFYPSSFKARPSKLRSWSRIISWSMILLLKHA